MKHLIIERTEGTPFFMEEMVQALFEDGALLRNGAVKLARPMNAVKVPATVQAVLASRIDRLPGPQKELLQTLAVLGREFPLELVQRVTLKSRDEVGQLLSQLQLGDFIHEQPAVGDVEYIFKHALTQEVAYNSLLVERRKLLHERVGQALESMFAGQLEDHLDELAHHYSRSDNLEKAVEYLGRAGQQALQRSAYSEAINRLTGAIDLLQKLPDSPERIRRELLLQLALGPALLTVRGWGVPEVERAYTRVRQLCELTGDPSELFPALWGLRAVYLVRGELLAAHELAEEFRRRAQSTGDPALQVYGDLARGEISFWIGGLPTARRHLEMAVSLYDPERHLPLTLRYAGNDAGVWCLSLLAWTLWQLGYPEQALGRSNEAVVLAQALSHQPSLAFAGMSVTIARHFRREAPAAQEAAERVIALSAQRGVAEMLVYATIVRGWAMAEQRRNDEGIEQMREGLAALRARGSEGLRPFCLSIFAEVCKNMGRLDEGLSALTEVLAAADEKEIRFGEAEAHRIKGELLLRQNHSNVAEAQSCFDHAIEIARKQSAKSWELRATTSLARLLKSQGKRDEARAILAEIYDWFAEGFDTADLKDAKGLLDELAT